MNICIYIDYRGIHIICLLLFDQQPVEYVSSLAAMYSVATIAALRDTVFDCVEFTDEMTMTPIDIDDVPLHVVSLLERTSYCVASDPMGNLVIW